VTGGENLADVDRMLRGTHGNAGVIPKQIADQLRGREFASFDEFRSALWRLVADSSYAGEFSAKQVSRMQCGLAPRADPSQWVGGLKNYVLHHVQPIHGGGPVFDLDNLRIVSPRLHQEILAKAYHFKLLR